MRIKTIRMQSSNAYYFDVVDKDNKLIKPIRLMMIRKTCFEKGIIKVKFKNGVEKGVFYQEKDNLKKNLS